MKNVSLKYYRDTKLSYSSQLLRNTNNNNNNSKMCIPAGNR